MKTARYKVLNVSSLILYVTGQV